jgi:hypothetical protein
LPALGALLLELLVHDLLILPGRVCGRVHGRSPGWWGRGGRRIHSSGVLSGIAVEVVDSLFGLCHELLEDSAFSVVGGGFDGEGGHVGGQVLPFVIEGSVGIGKLAEPGHLPPFRGGQSVRVGCLGVSGWVSGSRIRWCGWVSVVGWVLCLGVSGWVADRGVRVGV